MNQGQRVRIKAVKFPHLEHHACFIGQTGTIKRIWKTKPFILVTMDSGKTRECCPEFLEQFGLKMLPKPAMPDALHGSFRNTKA